MKVIFFIILFVACLQVTFAAVWLENKFYTTSSCTGNVAVLESAFQTSGTCPLSNPGTCLTAQQAIEHCLDTPTYLSGAAWTINVYGTDANCADGSLSLVISGVNNGCNAVPPTFTGSQKTTCASGNIVATPFAGSPICGGSAGPTKTYIADNTCRASGSGTFYKAFCGTASSTTTAQSSSSTTTAQSGSTTTTKAQTGSSTTTKAQTTTTTTKSTTTTSTSSFHPLNVLLLLISFCLIIFF